MNVVVVSTNPIVVHPRFADGFEVRFRITNVETPVHSGDRLRVYGVVQSDHTAVR